MADPLYHGEAICKRWGDSSSGGRTVTLQLEDGGDHPFRGYEGERFAIVVMPIGNDEKPMAKSLGGSANKAATSEAETVKTGPTSSAQGQTNTSSDSCGGNAPPPAKPKKRWHEMPASQRAALLISDTEFQRYAYECAPGSPCPPMGRDGADKFIKWHCNVASKSELVGRAAGRFDEIEGNFQAWKQAKGHGAA